MNSGKLTHLIYTSAASAQFKSSELQAILHAARSKNARQSITGMLLHSAGSFFQVLEGDETTLTALFAVISADPRHANVTKIIDEPIARRDFADWTMGFSEVDPAELEAIDGLSDFFQQGNSLTSLEPGRAKKLLSAFAQGRWHARVRGAAH
jgi:hypothetical protein